MLRLSRNWIISVSYTHLIDGIFVSRLVGSEALSAINIVFPVLNVLIAVGIMLASGGSAVIAKKFGEDKSEEARRNFSMIVFIGVLFGIAVLILGNIAITPIVRMLGSTPLIEEECVTYLSISLYFAPACMLQMLFQTFFVTAGKPHMGLAVTICGGITNAVLDYVFMLSLIHIYP